MRMKESGEKVAWVTARLSYGVLAEQAGRTDFSGRQLGHGRAQLPGDDTGDHGRMHHLL